jgi:hypothetical protein
MDFQVNWLPYRFFFFLSLPFLGCYFSGDLLDDQALTIAPQFEWAWNTPYRSRHLLVEKPVTRKEDSNLTKLDSTGAIAGNAPPISKSKKALFPRSIGNRVEIKLKVLRKMMTTLPWSQYPLKVLFFEESAYRLWLEQAKPPKSTPQQTSATPNLSEDTAHPIEVTFRPEGVDGMRKERHGIPSTPDDQCKPIEVHDGKPRLPHLPSCCHLH